MRDVRQAIIGRRIIKHVIPNKALHLTAISLRFIAASELGR